MEDLMSLKTDVLFQALMSDLSEVIPRSTLEMGLTRGWSPDMTYRQVAAIQMARSFFKKLRPIDGLTTPEGDAAALNKFENTNNRVSSWTFDPNTSGDEELMGEFKNALYNFWYHNGQPLVHDFHELFTHGRTGPGVSVGARGEDFYTKLFDSPLSVTKPCLYDAYWQSISTDEYSTWRAADSFRSANYGEYTVVEGSRFHFVPKDDKISRLIAIEPSLNMFYQLGLGARLEQRLLTFFGLDLPFQPWHNQDAARIGSLDGTMVTLDLSEASDSLGLPMLKWALPASMMAWLELLRSPKAAVGERTIELNMISTMGNGYTFPLETVIFSCVIVAALRSLAIKPVRPNSALVAEYQSPSERMGWWGVFGDDLFCHKEAAPRVVRLLTLLGFVVNSEKSFVEGPFRESCGHDYFNGRHVRGVYIKTLHSVQSRYAAVNALNAWSARTGIFLPETVSAIVSSLRAEVRTYVPPAENDDAGLKVPMSMLKCSIRRDRDTKAVMYRRSVSNPKILRIGDGDVKVPKRMRNRRYNPSGLMVAFLHGSVRNGRISVRQADVRYRSKWHITPNWDFVPRTSLISLSGFSRWETATRVNMGEEPA
jgi:hypothetical protein